jgi:hypothetical protein
MSFYATSLPPTQAISHEDRKAAHEYAMNVLSNIPTNQPFSGYEMVDNAEDKEKMKRAIRQLIRNCRLRYTAGGMLIKPC